MIKSMTGYGSGKAEMGNKTFTVEIKSVNSRYSDFSVKMPRVYTFLEDAIRKAAQEKISRGKADIYVNVESNGEDDSVVKVNTALAKEYLCGLRAPNFRFPAMLRLKHFSGFPIFLSWTKHPRMKI